MTEPTAKPAAKPRASRAKPKPAVEAPIEETVEAEIIDDNVDTETGEVRDDMPERNEVLDTPRVHAMLDTLPRTSDMSTWTDEQMALLDAAGLVVRKGQAPPQWAPRATVAAFLQQCKRTGLDPIARQIYCIERGGKWTIQVSIDGARLIAQRSGEYRGQTPAQWTGDGKEWFDVWLFSEPPRAARVGVYREGFAAPLFAVARWDSYAVFKTDYKTKAQTLTSMWQKMPDVMLAKVAEMLALRKAFPQDLSGLYSSEEMEQAGASTSAQPALTAGGVSAAPPAVVVTPQADAAESGWVPWKKAIDEATTVLQLQQITQSASKAGILANKVPGQPFTVQDYINMARLGVEGDAQPEPSADPLTERMRQGLMNDGRREEAEVAMHEQADHD